MTSFPINAPAERRDGRLASIQFLRGLAALSVTLAHALPYCGLEFRLGTAGVDLFFVISGFVMVYASEKYFGQRHGAREFMMRRLVRIVPIYWAATSIALFLMIFWGRDASGFLMTPGSIAASYLFIPFARANGYVYPIHSVGWTLYYEMFFYACFSAAVFFPRRIGVPVLAAVLVALVVLNQMIALPMPLGYWLDPTLLEFVAGMMIGLALRDGVRISPRIAAAVVVGGMALLVVLGGWLRVTPVVAFGLPATIMVAACALGFGSLACRSLTCSVAVFLGEASYALYLLHPFAVDLARTLIEPTAHPWMFLVAAVCLAIGAAGVVYLAFEKPLTLTLQRRVAAQA